MGVAIRQARDRAQKAANAVGERQSLVASLVLNPWATVNTAAKARKAGRK